MEKRFDAFMEMHFERTLGRLVTAIRAIVPLPDEVINALKECNHTGASNRAGRYVGHVSEKTTFHYRILRAPDLAPSARFMPRKVSG